jgi:hypothetical protein
MKKIIGAIAGLALATGSVIGQEPPKGWFKAGSAPKDYAMTTDCDTVHSGKASASLKHIANETSGFGTLMQTFKADRFRGKRLRLSGYVRSKEVGDWAGLWMRVDGPQKEPLSFDNMQKRAIKGTSDWVRYGIVLDVPESAQEIAFGLLLSGTGQVWMDDLKFEVVGKDVATTGESMGKDSSQTYANLDFEE